MPWRSYWEWSGGIQQRANFVQQFVEVEWLGQERELVQVVSSVPEHRQ